MRCFVLYALCILSSILVYQTNADPMLVCDPANTCCVVENTNVTVEKDVLYGYGRNLTEPYENITLFTDIYRAAGSQGPMPVVIWVHGGNYDPATNKSNSIPSIYYSAKWASRGFLVFNIEYRRWGTHLGLERVDDPVEDLHTAVNYVRENAVLLGADPTSIGISGCSAGGITVTHSNMFAFPSTAGYSYVVSICGGVLENGTASSTKYPWPTQKNTPDLRPQLSVCGRNVSGGIGMSASHRENATTTYLKSHGIPTYYLSYPGSNQCPLGSQLDDTGDEIFEGMVAFALKHTLIKQCTNCGNLACHEYATCSNNSGNFTCTCKRGFTGNGESCTDINECSSDTTNNCYKGATICSNTIGSFTCACIQGTYDVSGGLGTACRDIDECTLGTHTCNTKESCLNQLPVPPKPGFLCLKTMGVQTVAIFVWIDIDGQRTPYTDEQIYNQFFGNSGDYNYETGIVSTAEQFNACSQGQLQLVPANLTAFNSTWPGVLPIQSSFSLGLSGLAKVENVTNLVLAAKGMPCWRFGRCIHMLPPKTSLPANRITTLFRIDSYYRGEAVMNTMMLMQGIVNQIGLLDSGQGSNNDGDTTCVMGIVWDGVLTDTQKRVGTKRCFNAPKTYELGWFRECTLVVRDWDTIRYNRVHVMLLGPSQYNHTAPNACPPGHAVGVRIVTGEYMLSNQKPHEYTEDLYIAYNSKTGSNAGVATNVAPANRVQLTFSPMTKRSSLRNWLAWGESATYTDAPGKDVRIKVCNDISSGTGFARVAIGPDDGSDQCVTPNAVRNECQNKALHTCPSTSICIDTVHSFICQCRPGYVDTSTPLVFFPRTTDNSSRTMLTGSSDTYPAWHRNRYVTVLVAGHTFTSPSKYVNEVKIGGVAVPLTSNLANIANLSTFTNCTDYRLVVKRYPMPEYLVNPRVTVTVTGATTRDTSCAYAFEAKVVFEHASGMECTNRNECALGIDNCHANATCTDTIGSFTCSCNESFFGNGVMCREERKRPHVKTPKKAAKTWGSMKLRRVTKDDVSRNEPALKRALTAFLHIGVGDCNILRISSVNNTRRLLQESSGSVVVDFEVTGFGTDQEAIDAATLIQQSSPEIESLLQNDGLPTLEVVSVYTALDTSKATSSQMREPAMLALLALSTMILAFGFIAVSFFFFTGTSPTTYNELRNPSERHHKHDTHRKFPDHRRS